MRFTAATYSIKSIVLSWKQGKMISWTPTRKVQHAGSEFRAQRNKNTFQNVFRTGIKKGIKSILGLQHFKWLLYSHDSCQMLERCCPCSPIQVYRSVLRTSSWTRAGTKIHWGTPWWMTCRGPGCPLTPLLLPVTVFADFDPYWNPNPTTAVKTKNFSFYMREIIQYRSLRKVIFLRLPGANCRASTSWLSLTVPSTAQGSWSHNLFMWPRPRSLFLAKDFDKVSLNSNPHTWSHLEPLVT